MPHRRTSELASRAFANAVAVLAVLVGVVLMQGIHCTDGMAMTAGVTQVCGVSSADHCPPFGGANRDGVHSDGHAGETPRAGLPTSPTIGQLTDSLGGVFSICLTFLVAVLLAVAGLRRSGNSVGSLAPLRRISTGIGRLSVSAPSLMRLCVLRT